MNDKKYSLRPYLLAYKWHYAIGIFVLLAVDLANLYIPQFIGEIIDGITAGKLDMAGVGGIIFKILITGLIIMAGRFGWRYFIIGASRGIEYRLRDDMFSHMETLSARYYNSHKTGDLMAYFTNDLQAVRMGTGMAVITVFDAVIMTVMVLVKMVVYVDFKLTLFAFIPLIFIAIGCYFYGIESKKRQVKRQDAFSYLSDKVQESIAGIRVVKAFDYIQVFYENESYEHTVFPGAVYVSLSTEYGTLYSKAELAAIHAVCQKREIPLFVDGARLAYALAADECDITLPELAQLCDVFYIGGTKCGALCGEAVVFCGMHTPAHPIPRIKQHGALLAKGRLTGVQFEALFTDGLYFEIGRQAIETAQALRRVLHERGYQFFLETPTNQQFVILPNEDMARIREHASIEYWEKYDETHTVVRFCTSWATTQEDIDALAAVL